MDISATENKNLPATENETAISPQLQSMCNSRHTESSFTEEVIWKLPGKLRIHPSLWSKDDVIHWLRWAEEEYSLRRTDDRKFVLNGRGLCLLTKDDFKSRSQSSGDVLYELLKYIRTHREALITHPFFSQAKRNMQSLQNIVYNKKAKLKAANCTQSLLPIAMDSQEEIPLNLSFNLQNAPKGDIFNRTFNINKAYMVEDITDCRLLLDYLYQLLSEKSYESYIKWEDKEAKIFRVVDPDKLAVLWGIHKNCPKMNYEKMSRVLQQYSNINLLKKEPGQKVLFRFLKAPEEFLKSKSENLSQTKCGHLDSNLKKFEQPHILLN
ncbi:transcription factor ETV7 [Bombina bombina]|uniref:transcription factor ETV7 n=1 Tax=Bombina bombina TaxID=8345 RepID=UPI00235AD3FA|nr:transcription factor ETV7 [Bombina bombina]